MDAFSDNRNIQSAHASPMNSLGQMVNNKRNGGAAHPNPTSHHSYDNADDLEGVSQMRREFKEAFEGDTTENSR